MRQVEKIVCLRTIDMLWLEHLENMDYLRDSVRLRAYGQRDPLIEYKSEGHKMFQALLAKIDSGIADTKNSHFILVAINDSLLNTCASHVDITAIISASV